MTGQSVDRGNLARVLTRVFHGRHKQPHPSRDWWTGIGSDCRPDVLSWQQVLEISQCQSALIMMPASQLSPDDLRNVGQALIIPSKFSQPSSMSVLILGLDIFVRSASPELKQWKEDVRNEFSSRLDAKVPGVYPKAEVAEGRRAFCRQTLV